MKLTGVHLHIVQALLDLQERLEDRAGSSDGPGPEVYVFPQWFGSREEMVVVAVGEAGREAWVYFGGRFAYEVMSPNALFVQELWNRAMPTVAAIRRTPTRYGAGITTSMTMA